MYCDVMSEACVWLGGEIQGEKGALCYFSPATTQGLSTYQGFVCVARLGMKLKFLREHREKLGHARLMVPDELWSAFYGSAEFPIPILGSAVSLRKGVHLAVNLRLASTTRCVGSSATSSWCLIARTSPQRKKYAF